MKHQLAAIVLTMASTSVTAVAAAGPAAADGPNPCVFGSKWVKSAKTRFEPGPPEFSLSIDNRGNPKAQIETWNVSRSTTIKQTTTKSGEVSTSISAGLKVLAEQKVDVKFGYQRSTEKAVTVTVTTSSQRSFPANTWSTWTKGIYTVTAKAVHKCYKPRQQAWVRMASEVRTWPVMNGWKYTVVKKG